MPYRCVITSLIVIVAAAGCQSDSSKQAAPGTLEKKGSEVDRVGDDVVGITFYNDQINDADLQTIDQQLPKLESLSLIQCAEISDQGFANLGKLKDLKSLHVLLVDIGDEAPVALSPSSSLQNLMLENTQVTGNGLAALTDCPLESLTLDGRQLTAKGLAALADLPHLQELNLHAPKVKLQDLAALNKLTTLVRLDLHGTSVSDAGLSKLAQLQQLEVLALDSTSLTNRAVEHLSQLQQLKVIDLSGAAIDDQGLEGLKSLKLRSLKLGPLVTDAGLAHLASMTSLEELYLVESKVVGIGAEHLHDLKQLKILEVRRDRISPAGQAAVEEFQQALPTCEVWFQQVDE